MTLSSASTRTIRRGAAIVAVVGAVLFVLCFVLTLSALAGMTEGDAGTPLLLGVPIQTAALPIAALLIGFGVVAAVSPRDSEPRVSAGVFVVLFGLVGLVAAWTLTAEKVTSIVSPNEALACDFSVLVQCAANLTSWQGAAFGFPNPLIGLGGWPAVIVVGVALLMGIRLPRWLWAIFTAGVTGAMIFVIWLMVQSIFWLGTLCPWCMVTWTVTIPTFWFAWAELLRRSPSARVERVGTVMTGWLPVITVITYSIVAVTAQLELDVINRL
jgi:uncharacterized membrane protein